MKDGRIEYWYQNDPTLNIFESNFAQLRANHGRIFGVRIPRPKLLPIG